MGQVFDEVFHVNVLGYLLSARVFYEHLKATGGSVVFTLSNAAFLPDGGGSAQLLKRTVKLSHTILNMPNLGIFL